MGPTGKSERHRTHLVPSSRTTANSFTNNLKPLKPSIATFVLIILIANNEITCLQRLYYGPEAAQNYDYYFGTQTAKDGPPLAPHQLLEESIDKSKSTPPLDSIPQLLSGDAVNQIGLAEDVIEPSGVHGAQHHVYGPSISLFSPIFNLQLNDALQTTTVGQPDGQLGVISDGSLLNFEEPGSGGGGYGWPDNNQPYEDTSIMDDSTTPLWVQPTPVMSSPPNQQHLATPVATLGQETNRPPVLTRRLPKLSVTAGQVWKYFIPLDTFIDEDGDLRQLKSSVYMRKTGATSFGQEQQNRLDKINLKPDHEDETEPAISQYFSWLQFDADQHLLYGYPTENNAGRHELVLVVKDKWGAHSDETIEIYVKQHQSIRAFTHYFTLKGIEWNSQRYPTMIDALIDFTKILSSNIYHDEPFKNFIMQSYAINNFDLPNNETSLEQKNNEGSFNGTVTVATTTSTRTSFTIVWSNTSLPVYPCNLSLLEDLFKPLLDLQQLKSDHWSLDQEGQRIDLVPSSGLGRALETSGGFRSPTSVSIHLQGACEYYEKSTNSNNILSVLDESSTTPKIRIKIGKLTWRLGEPIEYRIPLETFALDNGFTTKDLQLSLHTIDGLVLERDRKYSYLEFDQDNQTIYGLPYDLTHHVGQRELQLTARNPITGGKVREVFIINVEPQDLTTINNRAFRMSLYMASKTGSFGARERVQLAHKLAGSLKSIGRLDFHQSQEEVGEFIVIDVQKYTTTNSHEHTARMLLTNNNNHQEDQQLARILDERESLASEFGASREFTLQESILYKYTWTNETIGHRGDCPVEVMKENVLYALEKSMHELRLPHPANSNEDEATSNKNDSVKFFEHLRFYFEPEIELIDLRFAPLGACLGALEVHDVGISLIADQVDGAGYWAPEVMQEASTQQPVAVTPRVEFDASSDEYWSIIVLIILVIALIFVIIMFFMGMHTYKINQDKRFELQVRLAQARQNSMYLSSMMLAANANASTNVNELLPPATVMMPSANIKSMYVEEEEKCSRKPMILDNEKQLLTGGGYIKPLAVQFNGHNVQTLPLDWQSAKGQMLVQSPSTLLTTSPHNHQDADNKNRSMTLSRRSSNSIQRGLQNSHLNHSHSILTVASMASVGGPIIHHNHLQQVPTVVYAQHQYPYMNATYQQQTNHSSLQRRFSHQRNGSLLNGQPLYLPSNGGNQMLPPPPDNVISIQSPRVSIERCNGSNQSYSSSPSASVISNPNYLPKT